MGVCLEQSGSSVLKWGLYRVALRLQRARPTFPFVQGCSRCPLKFAPVITQSVGPCDFMALCLLGFVVGPEGSVSRRWVDDCGCCAGDSPESGDFPGIWPPAPPRPRCDPFSAGSPGSLCPPPRPAGSAVGSLPPLSSHKQCLSPPFLPAPLRACPHAPLSAPTRAPLFQESKPIHLSRFHVEHETDSFP